MVNGFQKCVNVVGLIVSLGLVSATSEPVNEVKSFSIESLYLKSFDPNNEQRWNASPIAKSCPDNFTLLDGRCYQLEDTVKKHWTEAKRSCAVMNAKLTRIENYAKLTTIKKYLKNISKAPPSQGFLIFGNIFHPFPHRNLSFTKDKNCLGVVYLPNESYMDLYECKEPNYFICEMPPIETILTVITQDKEQSKLKSNNKIDSTPCNPHFILIGENCYFFSILNKDRFDEPDDENKNCVQLFYTGGEYFMETIDCFDRTNYICAKKPEEQTKGASQVGHGLHSEADQLSEAKCLEGFVQLGEKCYSIQSLEKVDWFAAQRICHSMNAQLLSSEDADELEAIANQLISLGHHGDDGWLLVAFWTSGNDLSSEGEFYWQSTGKQISYAKWYDSEPNNYDNMENCVELRYFNGEYFMNDMKCSKKNFFICETNVESRQICSHV